MSMRGHSFLVGSHGYLAWALHALKTGETRIKTANANYFRKRSFAFAMSLLDSPQYFL